MNILGINAFHGDASAALVVDGQLVAAVEEERFNRIKHWAGFPAQSIRWCLQHAGVRPEQVQHVAISFDPRANFWRRLGFVAKARPSFRSLLDRLKRQGRTLSLEDQYAQAVGLKRKAVTAQFHRIEHHQTHVASGFLISPFDRAAVLSVDGMGDFTSTLTAMAAGNDWQELNRVYYPHSIGFLYTAVTMYLGFPYYGDEYKVMGLAPYGQPEFADLFRRMIRPVGDTFELNLDFFTHHRSGIKMNWNDGAPTIQPFYSALLEKTLGPARQKHEPLTSRHDNLAKSLQVVTEEILMHLLNRLHLKTGCENLCMTGGVAMNSVANGKVYLQSPFKRMYLPAAAGDAGGAIGSAFVVQHRLGGNAMRFHMDHGYWGPGAEIGRAHV